MKLLHCRHENTSGFYRVSAYFLSTVICDVIPMRLVPTTVFAAIVYFMIGKPGISSIYVLTALPAKSDSEAMPCLQLLSKTLTCTHHLSLCQSIERCVLILSAGHMRSLIRAFASDLNIL